MLKLEKGLAIKDLEQSIARSEERANAAEKRLDDMKWFIGGSLTIVTLVFGVVTAGSNINFASDKTRIESQLGKTKDEVREELIRAQDKLSEDNTSLRNDIKQDNKDLVSQLRGDIHDQNAALLDKFSQLRTEMLGQGRSPELQMLKSRGTPLKGETVIASSYQRDGIWYISLHLALVNAGRASSGLMSIKFYTQGDLPLSNPSTDELPPWEYEFYGPSNSLGDGKVLPGLGSVSYEFHFDVAGKGRPSGIHPMLVRIFYGGDSNASSITVPFKVDIQ